MEVYAGEKAFKQFNTWLPDDTVEAFSDYLVGIKGPLTTPIGGGIRSLNVALRQLLDLYVCLRPVRWFKGVPTPVKPSRESSTWSSSARTPRTSTPASNGRRGYARRSGSSSIFSRRRWASRRSASRTPPASASSRFRAKGTERLIRAALDYAITHKRKSLTIVHKGNIMKFTEGAFRDWGYALAKREYQGRAIGWDDCGGKPPAGQVLVKDNIADITLQQVLTRPDEFDVVATRNLNGDYLSDALAAQVGGIGIAPGANINYLTGHAIFEATHGTAPKYANQDKVNPGSVILSGVLMFEHLGWQEAADAIVRGLEKSIANKTVTYDFERLMTGAKLLKCSEFGKAIVDNM